ncbi:MAG: hypothetical protein CM15mP95_0850 [Alphaproteobacteria bacterium]|nr:MAG: hypothetical protein CM15mP95_0850 [Alphaproteobacteria bacterium]
MISWGALHLAEATSRWEIKNEKLPILGSVKSDGIAALVSGFPKASSAEKNFMLVNGIPFLSLSGSPNLSR